jgi:hypothetical protein
VAQTQTFFSGKGNENHELGASFLVHKRIISAPKGVEFLSDRKSNKEVAGVILF